VLDLRRRLGLDSGYVSRLLRSLEAQGLVRVVEDAADRRRRVARLTARGVREHGQIDRLSNELAWSLLEPLDEDQRTKLAAATETVSRLLTASLVTVEPEDAHSRDARWCVRQYFSELERRFEGGFRPAAALPAGADALSPPRGLFLVARLRGRPVGCGGLKHVSGAPPEIKRMWVDPTARGLGLGRRLLRELEAHAAAAGAGSVRLETNRALVEAIALYRSSGYQEVPPFNDEPYGDHWFEKRLA
jgi:GNAT superfamily N-acetyltransferase